MRVTTVVDGERWAQVANPDPFALPVWRSPVHRTPHWVIVAVQAARLICRLVRFLARHPIASGAAALAAWIWVALGWPALAAIAGSLGLALAAWRWRHPASFTRFAGDPARSQWRSWCYRRRWHAVMTIAGLSVTYRGRVVVPALGEVWATAVIDRVVVRLVSGQSPADVAAKAEGIAHGFGVRLCRVRAAFPGAVVLELVRKDALAVPVPALPIPRHADLRALPAGVREDGAPWLVRLAGTHVLVAGDTGAGKASLLWGLVRAMLPAMAAGLVQVHAADPKLMELAYGRAIFEAYGSYSASPAAIALMLEEQVKGMQERAARFAGKRRDHQPTPDEPFVVIIVDEVAFLTAYQPDKRLRDRIMAALATLTTQGRAVGYAVVAALQDPRKEVLTIRNLFPDRIAMRLREKDQVDLVLGEGARDRGALADLIPVDPADPSAGAGVAYVLLGGHPDPVRVRAGWVTDADITAMCAQYAPAPELAPGPRALEGAAR